MKKALILVFSFLFFVRLQAQKPKLVVGIVVDQMRYDYLEKFRSGFGKGGFNRLLNRGLNFSQCRINYFPSYTAPGHASIYTGTTPAVHGIVANEWFERWTLDTMYCVSDVHVTGVGSSGNAGKMSPANLYATTMTDQLKLSNGFQSKVYSICIKDRGSILPGGHYPDGCFWFDSKAGKWITSSYYAQSLPDWVQQFNDRNYPDRLLRQTWKMLLPSSYYNMCTADDAPYEAPLTGKEIKPVFPHILPEIRDGKDFGLLLKTPFGNTLTRMLAQEALMNEGLGQDTITDFLAISFSSTDYVGHHFGIDAMEVADTYYRLDRELDSLFQALDQRVGKDNYMVFLTADHGCAHNPDFLKDHHMPGGFFDEKSLMDSLNNHLARHLKTPNLILYAENQQIYLNDSVIQLKFMNKKAIADLVASMLMPFEGIEGAVTSDQLGAPKGMFDEYYRRGYRPERCGDVYFKLKPGWMSMPRKTGTTHGSPYDYDTHIPFLLMGKGLGNGTISTPVSITDIAPTICNFLNIQYPDGTTGKSVLEKKQQ